MTTYIVKEKNELHIYREDQKDAFLADYGPMILMEGNSIQNAIIKFDDCRSLSYPLTRGYFFYLTIGLRRDSGRTLT
jgi:hypothetical protein